MDSPELTIVIPTYNEARRIGSSLKELAQYVASNSIKCEIIVVDDGSVDGTLDIVRSFVSDFPHAPVIKIIDTEIRLRKGGSIRVGIENSHSDFIILMDADLPTDLQNVGIFHDSLSEGADLVIGTRFGGEFRRTEPLVRRFLSIGFHRLFELLFKLPYDSQCSFKAVRKTVALQVLEHVSTEDFAFDVDFLVEARNRGIQIVEIPIRWYFRKWSKIRIVRESLRMLYDLLKIWVKIRIPDPLKTESEREIAAFYDAVPGDVREKAAKSWLLPRRLWYEVKDHWIVKTVFRSIESNESASVGRILDVGCGSGNVMDALSKMGIEETVGVDVSRTAAIYVRRRMRNAECVRADARFLPFRGGTFDVIVCSEVLEHLKGPEKALFEFSRVLCIGHSLVLTTPRPSLGWFLTECVWTRIRHQNLEVHHSVLGEGRIRYLLDLAGFKNPELRPILGGLLFLVFARVAETSGVQVAGCSTS